MNAACSSCLELFTSRCDISTTPCGHVFHTDCITKWFENQKESCAQCRESCRSNQLIKLYFSEGDQENNLVAELLEENLKLKTEANEAKSENNTVESERLKVETELNRAKTETDVVKSDLLKLQSENVKLQTEVNAAKFEANAVKSENLKLKTEANQSNN